MRIRRVVALVVAPACLAGLAFGATAVAGPNPRTITITDPRDAPAALSGPANPDVRSAGVSYDAISGTITVSLDFYASVETRPPGDDTLAFDFGASETIDPITGCDGNTGAGINLFITPDYEASVLPSYATLSVQGETGALQVNVDHAPGSTSYSATFTNAALVNQPWRCASVGDLLGIPACPYYPICDPATTIDTVSKSGWFTGYSPVDTARPYWRVKAKRNGLGGFDLYVSNPKIPSPTEVDSKVCIAIKGGKRRCEPSTVVGPEPDDLTFALDGRVLRPLRVTIYVGGVLQASRRVILH